MSSLLLPYNINNEAESDSVTIRNGEYTDITGGALRVIGISNLIPRARVRDELTA